ncbi:kinase-like domain-containing protein, partial [Mycena floridula]
MTSIVLSVSHAKHPVASPTYNYASRPPSALLSQGRRQSPTHNHHSRSRPPSSPANRGRRQSSAHRSDHSRFGSDSDVSILSRALSFDYWQDLTGKVQKLESFPFDSGAVADVYRGEIKPTEQAVAIKTVRRLHTERNGLTHNTRYLYEEANKWHTLSHENVLSLLGIGRDIGPSPALILPFCQEETVMKYLQRNSKTPVEKLDVILCISTGLSYLHSHGLMHGSLATSKILMTDAGVPAIGGYGMSNVLGRIGQTANMVSSPVRFTAPECFAVEEPAAGRQAPGDVHSLSMVMLE